MQRAELTIVQIPAGPIETNAFVVIEPASQKALIVDAPPDSLSMIRQELERHEATAEALVITHTHWDHIGDAAAVAEALGVPVWVHELERDHLANPTSSWGDIQSVDADNTLSDGDEMRLGDRVFAVLHTPGHSPGQISLYSDIDNILLGGDTLFPNGYGRVDIPGASAEQTVSTITRLLELPDEVTVLPGHGAATTIGRERRWMEQVARSGHLLE